MQMHLRNNGENCSIMASNKLKVQAFRANDLSEDTGKQFELGKTWCDFFEIADSVGNISFRLEFKPLNKAYENLKGRQIDLQLSGLTNRNDRKAYANGTRSGHSAIKEFFLQDLHLSLANNSGDFFAIYKASETVYYLYYIPKLLHDNFIRFFETISPTVTISKTSDKKHVCDNCLQQIIYGAPGTGKSHKIKDDENVKKADEKNLAFRTTFHPDSDYSTFVGAYKPTMRPVADKYKAVAGKDEEITYSFVPQAFLQSYVAAWNNLEEKVFLIIEEINRGNCAQIFGDLFQLLDRNSDGFSEYPIMADKDLAKYLKGKDEDGQDVLTNKDGIKDEKLRLPKNLYIWATMNTSDQSLFPIDSAFKRRWDWKYIPIKEHPDKNYKIEIGEKTYDWWGFLERINKVIGDTTSSEDKKLGYFFVKTETSKVSDEQFVGKVLFYLWNDVFKNYGFDNTIFSKGDKDKFVFSDFFNADGSPSKDNVQLFLKRVEDAIKIDRPLDITPKEETTTVGEEATVAEA